MSALTDLFTDLANKIRSKTGTSTTYTPLEMVSDGIDDVYSAGYDAGGGGATGIPITPSNASPVNLTTGDSYQMLADGYAIASYTNVTPSNSNPVTLSNDTICKMNGAGKAVASVTNITPSDSSPVSLSSGNIYKAGGSGYAIGSYSSITPSSSSPVSLSSGSIYKPSSSGYAIDSYSSISPSSSGTYFSSGMKKMGSSGYAYSSQQSAEMDFFDTLYSTSGQQTYTFTNNLKVVYTCVPTNSTSSRGTYTGSGSMTSAYTGTYQVINKITNVKSGDTFKAPSFGVSGTNRTILFFVGKKA